MPQSKSPVDDNGYAGLDEAELAVKGSEEQDDLEEELEAIDESLAFALLANGIDPDEFEAALEEDPEGLQAWIEMTGDTPSIH